MNTADGTNDLTTRCAVPAVSKAHFQWFTWYARGYLRRHFHSLRVSLSTTPLSSRLPLVIYLNHASWWDPLVCLALKQHYYPERVGYAPMDAKALERYRLFRRLGFFGVEQGSRRGAAQFLRVSTAVLGRANTLLVVTPQSRFEDARARPVRFLPGLGALAARTRHAVFVPMAVEYVYWEERLPEILVRFGESVCIRDGRSEGGETPDWTGFFEARLAAAQDALSSESMRRDPLAFEALLRGAGGPGGVYDLWRWLRARWRGEPFVPEHGLK